MMSTSRATLHVMLKKLDGSTEYLLLSDGVELARFTTGSNGSANFTIDLLATGDTSSAPVDPRGALLTVSDGVNDVLEAWVMADPLDDPHKAKIKECTDLEADLAFAPEGAASARYDLLPNGRSRLSLKVVHAPAGDYDLLVDDAMVATFTPNSAGNAKLSFRSTGPKGKSKPHNQKLGLGFDPRHMLIEIQAVGTTDVYFSGEMLAQIPGVNACAFDGVIELLSQGPFQTTGAGEMALGTEDDCDRFFDVSVSDLADGSYDVAVGGALVAPLGITVVGGVGQVRFETNADDPGELELDFALDSGSTVTVEDEGVVMLKGVLPVLP
jgi:hypothetical protein